MIHTCHLLIKINVTCLKKRIKRLQTPKFHFKFAYRFLLRPIAGRQRQCNHILNYQYLILKLIATHTAHMTPITYESTIAAALPTTSRPWLCRIAR